MNDPRGSVWRKWDLQVHTPDSIIHSYSGPDPWDRFIQELEQLPPEFKVIGINDYIFIEGYKRILAEKARGRLANIELFLPVIELRIDKFGGSSGHISRVNYHIIFSNELSPQLIEQQFLNALSSKYELLPQYDHLRTGGKWAALATKDSLKDLGRLIIESVPRDKQINFGPPLKEGFNNLCISLVAVNNALQSHYFKDKHLTAVGKTEWADIKWNDHSIAEKKTIINTAKLVFISAETPEHWAKAKKSLIEAGVNDRLLDCSDAHMFTDAANKDRIGKCFTWIKADPTFEGLKQIVYEPQLRVRIQEEDPSESETYGKISSLTIGFPQDLEIRDELGDKTDFCLNGKYTLEFSNNLTCIIGGRGSGKSTLAHVVYNSWINNDPNKLTAINSPLLVLEMPPSPLKKVAECTVCDAPSQTEFFFQNEIEQAAKTIEPMSALITSRLQRLSSLDGGSTLDDLREDWNSSSRHIDEVIDAYDQLSQIDSEIRESQENINTLKKQIETIKSEEYRIFQSGIGQLSAKIADSNSYRTDYEKLIRQIDSLANTITQLKWSDNQGKTILASIRQTLEDHKRRFQQAFEKYMTDYHAQDFPCQLSNLQQEIGKYLKARGLSAENVQELAQANTKIKELEEHIRLARLKKMPYEEVYNRRSETIKAYKLAYETYRARLLEVNYSLQKKLAGLCISKKGVTFGLVVDQSRLKNALVAFVKANLEDDASLRSDATERLLFEDADIDSYIQNKIAIRKRLNQSTKAEKHRQIIQEHFNHDVFLEKFHLRMLKHYFSIENIHVQTKLGAKLLKNTSFGERCGIVVAIVLVAGTNPIVMDQPEDHLDGKFVSNVLVPLLRTQKHNRQIILVTRDANVVVSGDAELIHILESTNERTHILPSTIEDITCREKYIWILDGGVEAFARREEKYDIESLRAQRQNAS